MAKKKSAVTVMKTCPACEKESAVSKARCSCGWEFPPEAASAATGDGDLADINAEWERLQKFNLRFAMIVGSEAFDDLDISVCFGDESDDAQLDYGELEKQEAISRLDQMIGGIPREIDSPDHWRDIANSECHLNVPDTAAVDDDLAFRIGRVLNRRVVKASVRFKKLKQSLPRIRPRQNRDQEFYRLHKQQKTSKEIARLWSRQHPDDPVLEGTVRAAIKRFRDKM